MKSLAIQRYRFDIIILLDCLNTIIIIHRELSTLLRKCEINHFDILETSLNSEPAYSMIYIIILIV